MESCYDIDQSIKSAVPKQRVHPGIGPFRVFFTLW